MSSYKDLFDNNNWFPGPAWEPTAPQALPALSSKAEPRNQCVPRPSLGTRSFGNSRLCFWTGTKGRTDVVVERCLSRRRPVRCKMPLHPARSHRARVWDPAHRIQPDQSSGSFGSQRATAGWLAVVSDASGTSAVERSSFAGEPRVALDVALDSVRLVAPPASSPHSLVILRPAATSSSTTPASR